MTDHRKIPPQNIEAEMSVLRVKAISQVQPPLSPEQIEKWAEDYIFRLMDLAVELGVKILPMFWGVMKKSPEYKEFLIASDLVTIPAPEYMPTCEQIKKTRGQ